MIIGAPMRPDEIRELMHQMNQPTLAHVLPVRRRPATIHPNRCSRADDYRLAVTATRAPSSAMTGE